MTILFIWLENYLTIWVNKFKLLVHWLVWVFKHYCILYLNFMGWLRCVKTLPLESDEPLVEVPGQCCRYNLVPHLVDWCPLQFRNDDRSSILSVFSVKNFQRVVNTTEKYRSTKQKLTNINRAPKLHKSNNGYKRLFCFNDYNEST